MANITYTLILKDKGVKAFIMPPGYWPDVEIHCWGAGGGNGRGGAQGGGGGYAKTIINVNEGDEFSLQIGQPGTNGGYPAGGIGGLDPSYSFFRGGNSSNAYDEDADTGAGGGGGGASWVAVNGTIVCVGAGGGGAGGYGDDGSGGYPGLPGGVTTNGLNTNTQGGNAPAGWATGGGGGAGFPKGGAAGTSYGDDSGNPPAGSGGQNYGNITVAGSGTIPGGTNVSYYPGNRRGEQGYAGYVVIVLRKKLQLSIKNADGGGGWTSVAAAYYKLPTQSISVQQSPTSQTLTYNSIGTTTWTVPSGVTSINVTVIGGGGAGGGADTRAGAAGRAGARVSGTLSVSPGQILTISVGSGGAGGGSGSRARGGAGGINNLGYNGGTGGSENGESGGGGGGGAASAVVINSIPLVVAGGGGGGGGAGLYSAGRDQVSPGGTSGSIAGGTGTSNGGDGGAGGGGGGGYPLGGAGGAIFGGDNGGYTGADGQSLVPAGFTLASANNGGTGGQPYPDAGKSGGGGSVTISYQSSPLTVTTVTGGWKQIQQAFTKVNGLWKPILTNQPISLYNYPVKRISANVSIVADTNDYRLFDSLPVVYYPGLMDITVWVYGNVTIRGQSTQSAFLVDNFAAGDRITIINYGRIQGRGGAGGAGGVYIAPSKNDPGTNSPGGAGGAGGGGLVSTIAVTLENRGNIAGGGGGGGGGGVGYDNNWKSPSYIQGGRGGGGAGFGSGYNNGTLTSGGAGENVANPAGDGGAGGARGQAGARGANGTYNNGGVGGAAGPAIAVTDTVTYANVGTVIGPIWATVSGLI